MMIFTMIFDMIFNNLFFNPQYYNLLGVGRYKINKAFDLNDKDNDSLVLTKQDIIMNILLAQNVLKSYSFIELMNIFKKHETTSWTNGEIKIILE